MNILFVTNRPPNEPTGQSIVSFELANAFLKTKHKIGIIYPWTRTELFINKNGLIEFRVSSIGDETFKAMNLLPGTISTIYNFIADFQPDVIHSQAELYLGLTIQLWAINHKIPFVQTIHFPFSKAIQAEQKNTSINLLYKFINTIGIAKEYITDYYHNCSAVIILNKSILKDLKDIGYKGNIYNIPNAVDKGMFCKIPIPKLGSRINLLYVGSICKRKNQLFLIKVMKYLPGNFHLTLVGDETQKKYKKELDKLIQKDNIPNIKFTGKVDYKMIPVFIGKSHLFVSASTTEMQSLAILEAMAGARPVVALENETTSELITPENGFVLSQEASPAEFANTILQIAKNSRQYYAMARGSRKKLKDYSWEKVVQKTLEVYQKLIKENQRISSTGKYKKFISKIPNNYIKKLLIKFQPKPKKVLEYKIKPKSIIIAGGAVASSIILYGVLKILRKMKKSNN